MKAATKVTRQFIDEGGMPAVANMEVVQEMLQRIASLPKGGNLPLQVLQEAEHAGQLTAGAVRQEFEQAQVLKNRGAGRGPVYGPGESQARAERVKAGAKARLAQRSAIK
jgi:hypothetical protein